MRVLLDGQPLSPPPDSVESMFRTAIAATQAQGRMIVDIMADGRRLSDDELEDPLRALTGVALVEITSVSPHALVSQSISNAADALAPAIDTQQAIAAKIHAGDTESALEGLHAVLSTWQAVRDVIDRGSAVLETDLTTAHLSGIDAAKPVESAIAALSSVLTSLMDALTQEDWSRVGDVLAYDLDALAKDWHAILVALAEHVASIPGANRGGASP
jgi:hypothetical protein